MFISWACHAFQQLDSKCCCGAMHGIAKPQQVGKQGSASFTIMPANFCCQSEIQCWSNSTSGTCWRDCLGSLSLLDPPGSLVPLDLLPEIVIVLATQLGLLHQLTSPVLPHVDNVNMRRPCYCWLIHLQKADSSLNAVDEGLSRMHVTLFASRPSFFLQPILKSSSIFMAH